MGLKYIVSFDRYEGLNYKKENHGEWSFNQREFDTEKDAKDFIRRIGFTVIVRNVYLLVKHEA